MRDSRRPRPRRRPTPQPRQVRHGGVARDWPLDQRRWWAGYCLATGIAGLALFGWFGAAWEADQDVAGLIQRLTIVVGWSWLPAVACRVLGASRPSRDP